MYLPLSLPLTNPYFAQWAGESGKKYEFAVVGAEQQITLDHPVVFVFAKHGGHQPECVYIGHSKRFYLADSDDLTSTWLEARGRGMTHLHLRFDAVWDNVRDTETADLIAGNRPPLNEWSIDLFAPDTNEQEKEETARLYYFPSFTKEAVSDVDRPLRGSDTFGSPLVSEVSGKTGRRLSIQALATYLQSASRCMFRLLARRQSITAQPRLGASEALLAPPNNLAAFPPAPNALSVFEDSSSERRAFQGAEGVVNNPSIAQQEIDTAVISDDSEVGAALDQDIMIVGEYSSTSCRDEFRAQLSTNPDLRIYLYAGDFTYQDGADLLTEALITVCRTDERAHFVLVGTGELRGSIEEMILSAGLRARCRLPGDLPGGEFNDYLNACDYVVIPAREARGVALANSALSLGKPVLTTHQARLASVIHGQNGLTAYDNANSLVWGLRELASVNWVTETVDWAPDRRREVA